MNYLSVNDLSKSFGERLLFNKIAFGLQKGEKAALVAPNGTGKTSLLKILASKETADTGEYVYRTGISVGYLEQAPDFDAESTVSEVLENAGTMAKKAIEAYNTALELHEQKQNDATAGQLQLAMDDMDRFQAWNYDQRSKELCQKLGIVNFQLKCEKLSGGQKKRLALAILLLDSPDIYILDEPTNHLDIEMTEWLEQYFSQSGLSLLMVTHDRYFLDNICTHIFEMHRNKLYVHHGNYSHYLQKKAERMEVALIERDKAKKLMKKEQEWVRRQPKARTTKSKARLDNFEKIKEAAGLKLEEKSVELSISEERIGGKILEFISVNKSFGNLSLLKHFSYKFNKGDRIGLIGKNGVGKTTFLKLILGQLTPDSGKIISGETIKFGYFSQEVDLPDDKRVIEVLKEIAEHIKMSDGSLVSASQLLEKFLFSREKQYTFVNLLSGGEKRRLQLLKTLMSNPNFLILDEPTNDLDLDTLDKLEEFLGNFRGCLLIVSHDRYFLDNLAEHLFLFKGGGEIKDYWGNYAALKQEEKSLKSEVQKLEQNNSAKSKTQKTRNKLSYNQEKEYKQLEEAIKKTELQKEQLIAKMNDATLDYEALNKLGVEINDLDTKLDELMEKWMILDELKNALEEN